MKKIFFTLSILSVLFIGCEDATDIFPVDQVAADEALTTPADIELALSGAYSGYTPDALIQINSRFSDNLRIGGDNGGQGIADINLVLNSNSGTARATYSSYYNVINRVNRILEAIETIDTASLSSEESARLNDIKGQSLALRALAHFDLLTLFSTSYSDDSALAVPYIDFVVILELPARNTVGEVFAGIEQDLLAANDLITSTSNIFMNKDLITALRAKIALFRGNDLSTAVDLADELIANYPLADTDEYIEMYFDRDDTEVIFKAARTVTDARIGGLFYFTGTGGAFFEMSEGLFNTFSPDDVRTQVLLDDDIDGGAIDPVSDAPSTIFIKKYPGRDGIFGLNDVKMYRVSEQYLIKAEAQARMNDLDGAAATIDILRDARYGDDQPTPSYASLEEAIDDILFERRLELAYEGHRYIDIKRTRDITNQGIIRNSNDCGGGTPCELEADDFRFTLPIPQAEVDVNPNIIQNPGYEG